MKNLLLNVICLSLLSPVCHAHIGETIPNGWWQGLLHPLTGIDHLLTLVAIGMLTAKNRQTEKLLLPGVFLCAMVAGFLISISGFSLDVAEKTIAVSVIMLGIWLISGKQLNNSLLLVVIAAFATAHGYVHGTEVTGSTIQFLSGFVSTAFLLIFLTFLAFRYALPAKNSIQSMFGATMTTLGLFYLSQV